MRGLTRRRLVLALLLAGALGVTRPPRRGAEPAGPLEAARARWETARAALRGCAESAREDAKRRAIAAAEELARCPGVDEDERVRVTLRAARDLASLGDERAQTLCQSLVDTTDGAHHVAATSLAGDLARRDREWERALLHYGDVLADPRSTAIDRDHASWWCARVYEELGRPEEAERVLLRLARDASDPLRRVHAWDRYARSLFTRGEVRRARDALVRCDAELASFASERSPIGRRVDDALRRMRCRSLLVDGS